VGGWQFNPEPGISWRSAVGSSNLKREFFNHAFVVAQREF
jgi:hypothetical protein